jgi:hypothetical protein
LKVQKNALFLVMQLAEAKAKFIADWGRLGTNWGINRTMAQIHALLMVSPAHLSAAQWGRIPGGELEGVYNMSAPAKLLEAGFRFRYERLETALQDILFNHQT